MTWTLKAHTSAQSTTGSTATTGNINTTGADIIFVGITAFFNPVAPTPTDSVGNTYVLVEQIAGSTAAISKLYYASATTGAFATSATHNFTQGTPGSNVFPGIYVQAFSGSGASPVDQINQSGDAASTLSTQPGSVTPTLANELLVTMAVINGTQTAGSIAINSSFNITDDNANTANCHGGGMAYFAQGAAAALNPTWSWTPACTDAGCVIGTFKGVAAAGGGATCLSLIGVSCGIALIRKLEENPIVSRRRLLRPWE